MQTPWRLKAEQICKRRKRADTVCGDDGKYNHEQGSPWLTQAATSHGITKATEMMGAAGFGAGACGTVGGALRAERPRRQ